MGDAPLAQSAIPSSAGRAVTYQCDVEQTLSACSGTAAARTRFGLPKMSGANGGWRQAEATPQGESEGKKRRAEERARAACSHKLLWDMSKGCRRNGESGNIRARRAYPDSGQFRRSDRGSDRSTFLIPESYAYDHCETKRAAPPRWGNAAGQAEGDDYGLL